ncbi:hypothetical protein ABIE89_000202 [Bradyrhizobium niftali]|uniref:hypothetical protein n=1 Tax=Bradyrhizobium niftali TaxID=2560055 RepID=UPI00383733C9
MDNRSRVLLEQDRWIGATKPESYWAQHPQLMNSVLESLQPPADLTNAANAEGIFSGSHLAAGASGSNVAAIIVGA